MRRAVAFLANLFLVLFLSDGALSLADDGASLAGGCAFLGTPRALVASVVFWGSVALWLFYAVSPVLPRSPFMVLAGFPMACAALATLLLVPATRPLSLVELAKWDRAALTAKAPEVFWIGLALSLAQCLVGAWALRALRRRGGAWLLSVEGLRPRFFSGASTAAWVAVHAVLTVVGLPLFLGVVTALTLEARTAGFLEVGRDGLLAVEKDYGRGDRTVTLTPMVHVARQSFYRELAVQRPGERPVILAEGVTDRAGLIRSRTQYRKLADLLGLQAQADGLRVEERSFEVRPADVDADTFRPGTRDFLERVARLFEGDVGSLAELARLEELAQDPAVMVAVYDDLIHRRNEHLLATLDLELAQRSSLMVPWGAAHLPGIEAALVLRGFRQTASRRRTLVRWGDLGRRSSPATVPSESRLP